MVPGQTRWRAIFNGFDLTGWTFRNPGAKRVWVVCDDVKLDPSNPGRLLPVGKGQNIRAESLNI